VSVWRRRHSCTHERDQVHTRGGEDAEVHRRGALAEAVQLVFEAGQLAQQQSGAVGEQPSRDRQPDAARAPLDERRADLPPEDRHLLGDRRLREVQPSGRGRERTSSATVQKIRSLLVSSTALLPDAQRRRRRSAPIR
jgi:hypothetical protein